MKATAQNIEKILHVEFDGYGTYQEPYNLAYLDADHIASIPAWSKCYRDDVEAQLAQFANRENYHHCINRIMECFSFDLAMVDE
jgi:hypothetical protein